MFLKSVSKFKHVSYFVYYSILNSTCILRRLSFKQMSFLQLSRMVRTSHSLNVGLPTKMARKTLKKMIFSMEKVVGPAHKLSTKDLFTLDKY